MKKRLLLLAFACILALFALSACDENQQVIHILKDASELASLNVTAYSDDFQLIGGAAMEPSFSPSIFDYTVYVAKDSNRFKIDAGLDNDKDGTVNIVCENDGETGTDFDYVDDEPRVMIVTAQIRHMDAGVYRLTVVRMDIVPVAEDVRVTVDPGIAAFFIGKGVLPKIIVTANLPAAGGELSYQWYTNSVDSTMGGYQIGGATSDTYTMRYGETLTVRTVYYYVEVTNTIDGNIGVTLSAPCGVTFLNKNELDAKSRAMVNIPAGSVNGTTITWANDSSLTDGGDYSLPPTWSTSGFSMGQNLVTWELWETVFKYADAANYRFSSEGNQGAAIFIEGVANTNDRPQSVGNRLHPVSAIRWRDAIVWCNAYSDMDGLEPVYRDKDGEPLRDSRLGVELLIDTSKIAGKNGYRLPTNAEWMYAARGAKPSTSSPWTDRLPGTNNQSEMKDYIWSYSLEFLANGGIAQTGEVGSKKPNTAGLYDMMGMLDQWVWWLDAYGNPGTGRLNRWGNLLCVMMGGNFYYNLLGTDGTLHTYYGGLHHSMNFIAWLPAALYFAVDYPDSYFTGLRLARNKD